MRDRVQAEARRLAAQRDALVQKIEQIQDRLIQLKHRMNELDALTPGEHSPNRRFKAAVLPELDPSRGLSDAIRRLLQAHRALSPPLIRDLLTRSGFAAHPNLLIKIHSSLKSLAYRGELRAVEIRGRTAYEWVDPLERALRRGTVAIEQAFPAAAAKGVPACGRELKGTRDGN